MPDTLTALCAAVVRRESLRARLWALLPRAHGGSVEAAREVAACLERLGWLDGLDAAGRALVLGAWLGRDGA